MTDAQKIEIAAILAGGSWSLTTVLLFATGKHSSAYAMLAIGTVVTTSLALVRAAAGEPVPGYFKLAEP